MRKAFRRRLSPLASCLGVPATFLLLGIVGTAQIQFLETVRKYLPASMAGPVTLGSMVFLLASPAVVTLAYAILLGAIRNRRARRLREQRVTRLGGNPV